MIEIEFRTMQREIDKIFISYCVRKISQAGKCCRKKSNIAELFAKRQILLKICFNISRSNAEKKVATIKF